MPNLALEQVTEADVTGFNVTSSHYAQVPSGHLNASCITLDPGLEFLPFGNHPK